MSLRAVADQLNTGLSPLSVLEIKSGDPGLVCCPADASMGSRTQVARLCCQVDQQLVFVLSGVSYTANVAQPGPGPQRPPAKQ